MFQNTSFSQLDNLVTNLKFLNCNFDQITQLCLEETTEQQTARVRGFWQAKVFLHPNMYNTVFGPTAKCKQ